MTFLVQRLIFLHGQARLANVSSIEVVMRGVLMLSSQAGVGGLLDL